jgi:hypothetical protein
MKTALLSFSSLVLVFLLSIAVRAGTAGPIPDGTYNCHKISGGRLIGLGELVIKGNSYRVSDAKEFAPFTIDSAGSITWSAGIGFLPEGWKLTSSEYRGIVNGKPMINIRYVSGSGNHEVIDCVKE